MAVHYEDFVRCVSCNHADFKEEVILTIPKILKPRPDKSSMLEAASREIRYVCSNCGHELDK
jgi:predicted RNA-binding Zn-ribbon protein involved in translation (DUF1610 family)